MAALRNRRERRRIASPSTLTMTSCHHHSGYLADDEAGHTTYVARVSVSVRALTLKIPQMFPNIPHHSPPFSVPNDLISEPPSDIHITLTTPLTFCWAVVTLDFIHCVP